MPDETNKSVLNEKRSEYRQDTVYNIEVLKQTQWECMTKNAGETDTWLGAMSTASLQFQNYYIIVCFYFKHRYVSHFFEES